jgi:4-hydroxythreonine-4-phosphate dehydrogenase
MGDPSGIGPEVALKALASSRVSKLADFFVIGDAFVIGKTKKALRMKADIPILDLANVPAKDFAYGESRASYGKASIEYIDTAIELLKDRAIDAVVTAPINKASINSGAVKNFKGHTEYLAEKTGTENCAMMFVSDRLKITLVTRHITLRDVPKAISIKNISRAIFLTHKYLKRYFGIRHPKIGVAGLNPHAGEGGHMGREEIEVMIPVLDKLRAEGLNVSVPLPADTLFTPDRLAQCDCVLAMYHDQGLPVLKHASFGQGVNITLGLPVIRTSVDHGTALDLAGSGRADCGSLLESIKVAEQMAKNVRAYA